jgi:PAS domain S-box-containing protein
MSDFPTPLKPPRSVRGLGAYLALAFSLLSIVLTLVLGEVVERAATAEVESGIGHSLAELAMQTADKLDRGMFERYREVGLMAQRADLAGADSAYRRAVLTGMQDTWGYYSWVGMAGLDGKVVASAHGLLEGADVSQRPWFNNALRGVHVGDVHDARLLAKLLPGADNEPKRFVDVAFPYQGKDGKPAGVLGVHLSWQWARDVEQSVIGPIAARRQVEALIVGADGEVLLGPAALRGKKIAPASYQGARGKPGYMVETWADGVTYLAGYARSTGYGKYPGLGWTVVVRQNIDNAYLPVKRIRQKTVWGGIALALLFSLAGVLVARRITRPLGDLARSAQLIQRGQAAPLARADDSYYEVKALSGTLNTLLDDLVQREHELQDLNANLERRVEERTRELERALVEVQASEQRIHTIIEAAQDAFVGVDLRGYVTDWNSQAQRMFGWSRKEALGRRLAELVVPERFRSSLDNAMRAFNQTGHLALLERRLERIVMDRRGVEFPIEMTAGLAGTRDTAFFSVFLHDISERKKIERMKSEFVATVSHELRTPLTSIRASLAMLADGTAGELPDDIQNLVKISLQSGWCAWSATCSTSRRSRPAAWSSSASRSRCCRWWSRRWRRCRRMRGRWGLRSNARARRLAHWWPRSTTTALPRCWPTCCRTRSSFPSPAPRCWCAWPRMGRARGCRCSTRAAASRTNSASACSSASPRPMRPTRAARAAPGSGCRSARASSMSTAARSASTARLAPAPASTSNCRWP